MCVVRRVSNEPRTCQRNVEVIQHRVHLLQGVSYADGDIHDSGAIGMARGRTHDGHRDAARDVTRQKFHSFAMNAPAHRCFLFCFCCCMILWCQRLSKPILHACVCVCVCVCCVCVWCARTFKLKQRHRKHTQNRKREDKRTGMQYYTYSSLRDGVVHVVHVGVDSQHQHHLSSSSPTPRTHTHTHTYLCLVIRV